MSLSSSASVRASPCWLLWSAASVEPQGDVVRADWIMPGRQTELLGDGLSACIINSDGAQYSQTKSDGAQYTHTTQRMVPT